MFIAFQAGIKTNWRIGLIGSLTCRRAGQEDSLVGIAEIGIH